VNFRFFPVLQDQTKGGQSDLDGLFNSQKINDENTSSFLNRKNDPLTFASHDRSTHPSQTKKKQQTSFYLPTKLNETITTFLISSQ
jgi:hypothetical protein